MNERDIWNNTHTHSCPKPWSRKYEDQLPEPEASNPHSWRKASGRFLDRWSCASHLFPSQEEPARLFPRPYCSEKGLVWRTFLVETEKREFSWERRWAPRTTWNLVCDLHVMSRQYKDIHKSSLCCRNMACGSHVILGGDPGADCGTDGKLEGEGTGIRMTGKEKALSSLCLFSLSLWVSGWGCAPCSRNKRRIQNPV